MKKFMTVLLALTINASMIAGCGAQTQEEEKISGIENVDYIFTNGKVYTENDEKPWTTCFAVDDGKFVYVGEDSAELRTMEGKDTVVVDLDGQMVTPNLIDAHTHVSTVGMTNWYTEFPEDVEDLDSILDFIQTYCKEKSVKEQPFIYFEYYPSELFGEEGPKKEVLDAIVSDRPILVQDFSDHACWVNSKFLKLIGAYDLKETDEGYQNFVRDEKGELTGWILEGAWRPYIENLYKAVNWYPPEEADVKLMSIVTDDLKKWGVTGVFSAMLEQDEQVESIAKKEADGTLNMYYDEAVCMDSYDELEDTIKHIHKLNKKYGSDHIRVDTMKIFYDGTNELGTSALIDGTVQDPDNHGYMLLDEEQTLNVLRRCNEEKIDVHFHMVGDLAFRQVCDATEKLIDEVGKLDIQVEFCHCELINKADMKRPAKLGIIVNWTPQWSGGYFGNAALQYLGEERYNSMYQFNPIIQSGGIVTFGSDIYSMEEEYRANPYFGMQTAMTRVDIDYPLEEGMRSDASAILSLEDLLKGYTINAAIQLRIDDVTGSIEVGKGANFNVYEQNLFDVNVEEFKDVMPKSVVFEGNVISGSSF